MSSIVLEARDHLDMSEAALPSESPHITPSQYREPEPTTLPEYTIEPTPTLILPSMKPHILSGQSLGPLFPSVIPSPFINANPIERNATVPGGELTKSLATKIWARTPAEEIHLYSEHFKVKPELEYADIMYQVTLEDESDIPRPFQKWDTVVMKGRHHPNVRYLITHRRFSNNKYMELQVNAYIRDGRCIHAYHSEWPAFILIVSHHLGQAIPRPDIIKRLDLQSQATFDNHIEVATVNTQSWFSRLSMCQDRIIRWIHSKMYKQDNNNLLLSPLPV